MHKKSASRYFSSVTVGTLSQTCGAEWRIDLAREYGYKDGSAIAQMLKRLELAVPPMRSCAPAGVPWKPNARCSCQVSRVDPERAPKEWLTPKESWAANGGSTWRGSMVTKMGVRSRKCSNVSNSSYQPTRPCAPAGAPWKPSASDVCQVSRVDPVCTLAIS